MPAESRHLIDPTVKHLSRLCNSITEDDGYDPTSAGKDGSIDHQHDWNQDDGEELDHRIDSQISFLQGFCMMPVNHREDPNDQQG